MVTTANFDQNGQGYRKHLLILVAMAALLGAAILPRGSDLTFAPQMAEQPVVLPDGRSITVQKYEVSIAEWNACSAAGACSLTVRAPANRLAADMPATGLSYVDAAEYITWINAVTRQNYRLPTLVEWQYMAAEVLPDTPDPLFTDPNLTWASAYLTEPQTNRALRPMGSFDTTAQGIVDLNGNVWEWTQDCYSGASPSQEAPDHCPAFYVAGEHIAVIPFLVRDPARGGCAVGSPPAHLGMRLVQ